MYISLALFFCLFLPFPILSVQIVSAVGPCASHITSLSPSFTVCKYAVQTLYTYRPVKKSIQILYKLQKAKQMKVITVIMAKISKGSTLDQQGWYKLEINNKCLIIYCVQVYFAELIKANVQVVASYFQVLLSGNVLRSKPLSSIQSNLLSSWHFHIHYCI